MFRIGSVVMFLGAAGALGAAGVGIALSETPERKHAALLAPLRMGGAYDFEALPLLQDTLFNVEESYVEPARIDWERMYVAALDRVERQVPSVLFQRQEQTIALSAGAFHTVLEVPKVETRVALLEELQRVAVLLHAHVPPADIPKLPGAPDAYAPMEYALVNGVLSTLDPHSILLPPEHSREMDQENQGEFGGLGISIGERDGDLIIQYPNKGSPAERAGLKADDRVVRINGELMVNLGLDDAVERLRGPVDEPVVLQVERQGSTELIDVTVVRKLISFNEVRGKLLDGGVGYVRIETFHGLVESGLRDELAAMQRAVPGGKLAGLILDLRGNPGGLLSQAVAVSDFFLSGGDIVSTTDGRGRSRDAMEAKIEPTDLNVPLVVLVDGNSASASEIVAGALRNNDRAVIVGERSFGKGSVQNLYDLDDGSKLKLTTQHYLTPGERSIQGVGIPADIALLPVRIDPGSPEVGDEDLRLHWREHLRREADLTHALVMASRSEESAWVVPFLLGNEPEKKPSAELHPEDEFEVQFSRDLLLAASSARRAQILSRVGPTVEKYRVRQERAIFDGFSAVGVDWSPGPAHARGGAAPLSIALDLGPDGAIVAGEEEVIRVRATNLTDHPLYQVSAAAADQEPLAGAEFYFGRINPGETREWATKVSLIPGYPTERSALALAAYDAGEGVLAELHVRVPVQGAPIGQLAWNARWDDAAPGGNGDGKALPGERISLVIDAENVGAGPVALPFFSLRSDNRTALDLVGGEASPGPMIDPATGEACVVERAGVDNGQIVGDAAAEPTRIARSKLPVYAKACVRRLDPGTKAEVRLSLDLREPPSFTDGWHLELLSGDRSAYDWASWARADVEEALVQAEDLVLPIGVTWAEPGGRRPPKIQVTRAPSAAGETALVTVSGAVTDDEGVREVLVFAGEDKVFYAGSSDRDRKMVPFTADVALKAGVNTLTVVAKDIDGVVATRSVVTFLVTPELTAVAGNLLAE